MIDFTFLEGRDYELVVKGLAAVDSHSNSLITWIEESVQLGKVPAFNARVNQTIDHGYNWDDGDVLAGNCVTSGITVYCFGPHKAQFISGLIHRKFIDINQLVCPPLADITVPGISCTFECYKRFSKVCALRTAFSLAQWLNFHIITLQYAKWPTQHAYHLCFPDDGVTSSYIILRRARGKARLRLPERES